MAWPTGTIVPSSNTTDEQEFSRQLPEGISVYTARMHLENANADNLERMAKRG